MWINVRSSQGGYLAAPVVVPAPKPIRERVLRREIISDLMFALMSTASNRKFGCRCEYGGCQALDAGAEIASPFLGMKPFCRGDETVLKQGAEYPLRIRSGRPKCNLSFISFERSRATDTSPQWANGRASKDRGLSSLIGRRPLL